MFAPSNYETTVMLFKLMCIAGLEIVMLVYLDWALRNDSEGDFPGIKKAKSISLRTRWLRFLVVCRSTWRLTLRFVFRWRAVPA
jgi:hypothetical protein